MTPHHDPFLCVEWRILIEYAVRYRELAQIMEQARECDVRLVGRHRVAGKSHHRSGESRDALRVARGKWRLGINDVTEDSGEDWQIYRVLCSGLDRRLSDSGGNLVQRHLIPFAGTTRAYARLRGRNVGRSAA